MKTTTFDRRETCLPAVSHQPPPREGSALPADLIDDYVAERIDFRVRELASALHLSDDQREDMRQDLIVELLQAAERYRSDVSRWHTMACRVIDLYSRHLSRQIRTQRVRESGRPLKCLTRCPGDRESYAPNEVADDFAEGAATRLDIEEIISQMPPRLQELCNHLKYLTPPKAAAKMGIHPNSVYRLLDEAKRHFIRAGYEFPKKACGISRTSADIAVRGQRGDHCND